MTKVRMLQYVVAGIACCLALGLAVAGSAVFRTTQLPPDASLWRVLFEDRVSLGFLRLAAVAAGIYVFASVPALIVGGRWLRAVGPSGVRVDELLAGEDRFRALEERLRRVKQERDEIWALWRETQGGSIG